MTPTLQVSCEILVKYQCFKVSFSLSNIRSKKAVSWHYITVSHVGNTICHHEKKKRKKERKENLQGSEQNVVGAVLNADPNGLPDDRIQFKEVAYPVEQIIFLFTQSPSSRVTRREVANIRILAMFRFQNLMRLKFQQMFRPLCDLYGSSSLFSLKHKLNNIET